MAARASPTFSFGASGYLFCDITRFLLGIVQILDAFLGSEKAKKVG